MTGLKSKFKGWMVYIIVSSSLNGRVKKPYLKEGWSFIMVVSIIVSSSLNGRVKTNLKEGWSFITVVYIIVSSSLNGRVKKIK